MTDLEDKKSVLDEKFMELKKLQEEKNKVITSLKELFDSVKSVQDKKKKVVEFIKQKKGERSKAQEKIKENSSALRKDADKKEDLKGIEDYNKLSKQIDKIEWTIWTESIPYKKEEELVKIRKELEANLEKAKEKDSFFKNQKELIRKLDTVKREQKLLHSSIVTHSKEWESFDKELKELFPKINEKKKKADELTSKIKSVRTEIGNIKGVVSKERKKFKINKDQQQKQEENQKKKKINKKVQEIKEKFKKGEKLTTEDFIVMGSSGEDLF